MSVESKILYPQFRAYATITKMCRDFFPDCLTDNLTILFVNQEKSRGLTIVLKTQMSNNGTCGTNDPQRSLYSNEQCYYKRELKSMI